MAITYLSGIPPVVVDKAVMLWHLDGDPIRTAVHISTDPVTGVAMFNVYFDDGNGNGGCLMSLPIVELSQIGKALKLAA